MQSPISVGIPFYNAETYLADAVRSILAQSYSEWELLLVDDGSTDRSLEIAHSIRDPRIRVVSDGRNRRLPFRLNQITALAKYEYIARMDADDLSSPVRFEEQLKFLELHHEYDLVTTGVCSVTRSLKPIGIRCGSADEQISGRKLLFGIYPIVHASILGRKSWFIRNPYDVNINRTEDYELWLRAFSRQDLRIYVLSRPLYYYREEENITVNKLLTAYASQRDIVKEYGYMLNRCEIFSLKAKLYGKSIVTCMLASVGGLRLLLNKRNKKITDSNMYEVFKDQINQIVQTKLPGYDIGV